MLDSPTIQWRPIGVARSCYNEKFGTPRQSGLVVNAKATIVLLPPFNVGETVAGLSEFSHLWLLYHFHLTATREWKARVRPPRLGGNRKRGVFATRSNFRPNSIGLSAVRLEKLDLSAGVALHVSGVDLVDGTPILDIKPYLPYADNLPAARAGYAEKAPQAVLRVVLSPQVEKFCLLRQSTHPWLRDLLIETLRLDPRPAYRATDDNPAGEEGEIREYGTSLAGVNFRWRVKNRHLEVLLAESTRGD